MPAPLALPALALVLSPTLAMAPLLGGAASAACRPSPADDVVRIVVAADGSGDATGVQEAVDLAPTDFAGRVEIVFEPGRYAGRVVVTSAHQRLSFLGSTGDPADVVIADDRANGTPKPGGGTWGTSGSASVTDRRRRLPRPQPDLRQPLRRGRPPGDHRPAGGRRADPRRPARLRRVRFLGNQDTLYVNSPAATVAARAYFRDCYVEGDVDFIFGRATAVFDGAGSTRSTAAHPNGYVTAPSTSPAFARGFLVVDSAIVSDAPDGSYYLGRPWHPSSAPDNNPRAVVRDTQLGTYLKTDPWTTMSGYDWAAGSNAEYHNSGPGAVVNEHRPQLSDAEAAHHEIDDYLAGADGWAPQVKQAKR